MGQAGSIEPTLTTHYILIMLDFSDAQLLAQTIAFPALTISVVAGLWCDWLGDGIKLGNRRAKSMPTTRFGRVLQLISRCGTVVALVSITFVFGANFLTS
jgi:hypothetical protein